MPKTNLPLRPRRRKARDMSTEIGLGKNACAQYEALLEDYLDGALDTTEARTAELHVQNCEPCRAALQQASASVRLFRAAGPSEGPGPAFARTVMARIYAAEREGAGDRAGIWQSLVKLGWRFAATATVVLAVLVTYDAGWGRHLQRNLNSPRLMHMNDIFAPDPANPPASRDEVLMMEAENHGN
jgi:anti-sigma-K factor RskA